MEGLLMASTRAHNARADARFNAMSVRARNTQRCRRAPVRRPRLPTASGNEQTSPFAPARKEAPPERGLELSSQESTPLPAALRIAPLIGRPVRRTVLSGARIV